jgi:hypothetical protein
MGIIRYIFIIVLLYIFAQEGKTSITIFGSSYGTFGQGSVYIEPASSTSIDAAPLAVATPFGLPIRPTPVPVVPTPVPVTAFNAYIPVDLEPDNTIQSNRDLSHYIGSVPYYDPNYPITIFLADPQTPYRYFFLAFKTNSGTYRVFTPTQTLNDVNNQAISFTLGDIASVDSSVLNLTPTTTTSDINESLTIFVFSSNGQSVGDQIDLGQTGAPTGVYINLTFNSTVEPNSLILNGIDRGDTMLSIDFDRSLITTLPFQQQLYQLLLINFGATDPNLDSLGHNYQTIIPKIKKVDLLAQPLDTSADFYDLTNGELYFLSIALLNKFQYVNLVPSPLSDTPFELMAFLKQKNCYLISAGFQRNHYVLEYFRKFRDQYLLKREWGKSFVEWYYDWSPKYAPTIYKHPLLAKMVRGGAYSLYYIMHVFYK